jgi:hypothetical protein
MRNGLKFIGFHLMMIVLLSGFAPFHQDQEAPSDSSPLTLSVAAGYDGLFRENEWFPLLIHASNDGPDRSGHLVVRPQTSGNAFNTTFTTPLDLPTGSRKSVFLHVNARIYATEVRVEFMDDNGDVLIAEAAPLRAVRGENQLYVVVTSTTGQIPNLTQATSSGFQAAQSIWRLENLPDSVESLRAIDRIIIHDIDTGPLSIGQQQALRHWVLQGGHLIVTGGSNWQSINAGLTDLLPISANNSETLSDFSSLTEYISDFETTLTGETPITTGILHQDATVLAQTADGNPIIARRAIGLGTVDYLSINPTVPELRNWTGMDTLWHLLASTTQPKPAWGKSDNDLPTLALAAQVIPGYDILPDGLNMLLFLTVYILVIGPLNYYVLNRLNRRELAWVTIPLCIVGFSAVAWFSGFNLRGNEVIINRMAVIQSWPDEDDALLNGMLGVLSPRRNTYAFSLPDGAYMHTVDSSGQGGFLSSSNNITVNQDIDFSTGDFLIDASYMATFSVNNTIPKPALSGQATVFYDSAQGAWVARGTVRNDTEYTLENPLLFARGTTFYLEADLTPGQIQSFEVVLNDEGIPANASSLERTTISGGWHPYYWFNTEDRSTLSAMLFPFNAGNQFYDLSTAEYHNFIQKRYFLQGILRDQSFADGRGDHLYLVGWSNAPSFPVDFATDSQQTRDLTLHIAQLDATYEQPTSRVMLDSSQFTWVALERPQESTYLSPTESVLEAEQSLTVRFSPLQNAMLRQVDQINILLNVASTLRKPEVEIWNWQTQTWDGLDRPAERDTQYLYRVRNPENYLDSQNNVQVRITNDLNVTVQIMRLAIKQQGEF